MNPILLACLASTCLGAGLVTARFGMRGTDARSGAAISVPTAAVFFVAVSIGWLDTSALDWRAVAIFAMVGLFFPATATLINFVCTERLGPSLTSSISGTSPLFGMLLALPVLGEAIPPRAVIAAAGIVAGVSLMSWQRRRPGGMLGWLIALSVAGAAVRGVAQVVAKAGLAIWSSPLAASLVGYLASASVLLAADRLRSTRPASRLPATTVGWFMATGLLNGVGLMMIYVALQSAPVALVSPIVASYPLVTLVLVAALVREEAITRRSVAGALVTIAAVAWLVAG